VIGQDDQREQQELVCQLRGELSKPDVPERGVPQDRSEAAWALDWKTDGSLDSG